MKTIFRTISLFAFVSLFMISCGDKQVEQDTGTSVESTPAAETPGQSAVTDDMSQRNVVQVAVGSPDHTTLVAAVKAAELVDVLSNVGPFTVFAPVNAAFEALPAGTVDNLMKPENKAALKNILEYHVYVGVIRENMIQDGMKLNQVNSLDVILNKSGNDITVNGAKVIATVPAANGIVYVIDKVLLPPDKK